MVLEDVLRVVADNDLSDTNLLIAFGMGETPWRGTKDGARIFWENKIYTWAEQEKYVSEYPAIN